MAPQRCSICKIATIFVIGILVLVSYIPCSFGQGFPDRTINLVVPYPQGDGTDIAGRLMADELAKTLRVPVVVLNKPGAAGTVGTAFVAKAKSDGYTILLAPTAPIIYSKVRNPAAVPYDPFKDLTPLGVTTVTPMLVVIRSDAPYTTFKEMLDYAQKNPRKLRFGTAGVGSTGEFNLQIIKAVTGLDVTAVPFEGGAPAVAAVMGGHVEAAPITLPVVASDLRGKKIKGILISSRFPEFPDISTLKRLGYQQDLLGNWYGFYGPAGLPVEVKETLSLAIEKVVKDPSLSSKMTQLGMVQEFEPPDKLLARMQEEYKTVEEIAKKTGVAK